MTEETISQLIQLLGWSLFIIQVIKYPINQRIYKLINPDRTGFPNNYPNYAERSRLHIDLARRDKKNRIDGQYDHPLFFIFYWTGIPNGTKAKGLANTVLFLTILQLIILPSFIFAHLL